jgi:hypothetical protein
VDEVDPASGRSAAGLVVQQAQAALAQRRRRRLDIVDGVRNLLNPGTLPVEKRRYGRRRA